MGGGQSPGTGGEPPQRGGRMAAHKHIADGQDTARADARSRGGGRAHGVGCRTQDGTRHHVRALPRGKRANREHPKQQGNAIAPRQRGWGRGQRGNVVWGSPIFKLPPPCHGHNILPCWQARHAAPTLKRACQYGRMLLFCAHGRGVSNLKILARPFGHAERILGKLGPQNRARLGHALRPRQRHRMAVWWVGAAWAIENDLAKTMPMRTGTHQTAHSLPTCREPPSGRPRAGGDTAQTMSARP